MSGASGCDVATLNQALIRAYNPAGWVVEGGAETLRRVGLEEWAVKAEQEVARLYAARSSRRPVPALQVELQTDVTGELLTRDYAPVREYAEHIEKLRAAQKARERMAEAAHPNRLLMQAMQPVKHFAEVLEQAGVIKCALSRPDILWPNCALEIQRPNIGFSSPMVIVYCVRAGARRGGGSLTWQINVWSDAVTRGSRRFTHRDGYDALFHYVTDCLARL